MKHDGFSIMNLSKIFSTYITQVLFNNGFVLMINSIVIKICKNIFKNK